MPDDIDLTRWSNRTVWITSDEHEELLVVSDRRASHLLGPVLRERLASPCRLHEIDRNHGVLHHVLLPRSNAATSTSSSTNGALCTRTAEKRACSRRSAQADGDGGGGGEHEGDGDDGEGDPAGEGAVLEGIGGR